MPVTNINIRVDNDIKREAQDLFSSMGIDMTTAINIFLRQSIRARSIPFPITADEPAAEVRTNRGSSPVPEKKIPKPGCMKGKIWMADDFDAPLDDFKEYME